MEILISGIMSAISSVFGDISSDKQAALNLALQTALSSEKLKEAQIDVNAEQAKSQSIFVAGPRPFVMWGCAIALLYNTLVIPTIISFFAFLVLCGVDPHLVANARAALPAVDVSMLYQMLGSLLGISIYPVLDTAKHISKYKVDNS